jgi:hypothetical protein
MSRNQTLVRKSSDDINGLNSSTGAKFEKRFYSQSKVTSDSVSTAVGISKPELSPMMLLKRSESQNKRVVANNANSNIKQFLNIDPCFVIPEEAESWLNSKSKSKSEIKTVTGKNTSLEKVESVRPIFPSLEVRDSWVATIDHSKPSENHTPDSKLRSKYLSKSEED